MGNERHTVNRYLVVVSAAGLGLFVGLMATAGGEAANLAFRRLWPFTAFVVLSQFLPVMIPKRKEEEITTSSTFAFAMVLAGGLPAAALALALASLVSDLGRRKPVWRAGFNIAQYTLSLAAGTMVLMALEIRPHFGAGPHFGPWDLGGILLAAGAFFLANNTMTGAALAMTQGIPLIPYLRRDLPLQAGAAGVLLALSPIVVEVAERTFWMVPLLGLPVATVYTGARVWLEKEARAHQATHDALTGLPNRSLYYERVEAAIGQSEESGPFAIMIIDLDRFKDVNDTLGHHAGDSLLGQIGARIRDVLREMDVVARLGGDEFAVLVPRVPDEMTALRVAERIREALETPFSIAGLSLEVDASIGIALFPDHGVGADDLIRHADVAMYMAKEAHSDYELYAPERDQHSLSRLTLLGELRGALDEDQLVLHYQPKAEIRTGRVLAAEALARWVHPRLGLLPPDTFIPLAERTGMMRPLTLFVLSSALQQCRSWHALGHEIGVAVNLSARNLLDLRFPDEVQRLLTTWHVAPEWLQLEITESAVMVDPPRAMTVLSRLAEMGVGVSLDDFGTGYSSLVYLKRLPVNEVKIDKSFITHMTDEENDAVIVESTIDLARSLGLRVVAEGVETREVWERLRDLGCDLAQGYFLARPMPAADLTHWLPGRGRTGHLRIAT